jgi:hypothetical protein
MFLDGSRLVPDDQHGGHPYLRRGRAANSGAFISSVPYVVAIIELDDCKQGDGTVTRVAGVLTDDYSKASKPLELRRLRSRQVVESTLSFACC